ELQDTVVGHPFDDVVEEDDATIAELRLPGLEVVQDGLVRLVAVDVKQVDLPIVEAVQSLVESHLEEGREARVPRVVVSPQVCEDLGTIPPALGITDPRIDREGLSR